MNNLNKVQKNIIIGGIIIAVVVIGYYVYGRETNINEEITHDQILVESNEQQKEESKMIIHVTGAVQNEGIVTLDENSRIADAVEAAGGLKEDADMSKINLAYILEDGMKIKIPSVNDKKTDAEEKESTDEENIVDTIPESNTRNGTGTVNINKASQTELEALPGIGPSIALKIINYREEKGKFSSIEDLKKVSGIGDSKFEIIRGLICVK